MASAAIGTALRKLREAHGFTQQDLADKTGVSRSHLCQVELGKTLLDAIPFGYPGDIANGDEMVVALASA